MRYYCHHVPGRLRVKLPDLKRKPAAADRVQKILDGLKGVIAVKVTPLTGSVVVHYDPDRTTHDRILAPLQDHGLFDASLAISNDEQVQAAVADAGMRLGRAALGWAVGRSLNAGGFSLLAAFL
ncbi:MAG: heavy-metal-associated domain-containing protein [Desulfobacterales bacterium]|jgi:copper chaperone CopZ|nr:heavy-metal-associated domain-containing protein [Desulfobacterales bacterium]